MKVSLNKRDLQETLIKCGVVSSKPAMPILGTILLETSSDKIYFTTTDLEITVIISVPAKIEEGGTVCLPFKKLNEIILEAEDKLPIFIEVDRINNVIIKQKSYEFRITGIKTDEFPPIPKIYVEDKIEMSSTEFKDLVRKTTYAAATGDVRFALNGVFFSLVSNENKLITAATDGNRLAINYLYPKEKIKKDKSFIVPKKILEDLARLIKEQKRITIEFSSSYAKFNWDDNQIITRLIEDTFPKYESVLPTERKNKWYVEKEILLKSCKRMSAITSDKINMIKFLLTREEKKVFASAPGIGEGEENIPSLYEGEDLEIAFNPNFIIDAVKNLDDEEIILQLGDPASSLLLVSKDKNYTAVVMPMRL